MIFTHHNGRIPKEIMSVKNKSCELDFIPTELLKTMLPYCIKTIAQIVNISLAKGLFATDWKTAIVNLKSKQSNKFYVLC